MILEMFRFYLQSAELLPLANLKEMACRDVNRCKLVSVIPRRCFVFRATGLLGGRRKAAKTCSYVNDVLSFTNKLPHVLIVLTKLLLLGHIPENTSSYGCENKMKYSCCSLTLPTNLTQSPSLNLCSVIFVRSAPNQNRRSHVLHSVTSRQ